MVPGRKPMLRLYNRLGLNLSALPPTCSGLPYPPRWTRAISILVNTLLEEKLSKKGKFLPKIKKQRKFGCKKCLPTSLLFNFCCITYIFQNENFEELYIYQKCEDSPELCHTLCLVFPILITYIIMVHWLPLVKQY